MPAINAIDWANLKTAIILACKARGDSKAHSDHCISDCRIEIKGSADQAECCKWYTDYFDGHRQQNKDNLSDHHALARATRSAI